MGWVSGTQTATATKAKRTVLEVDMAAVGQGGGKIEVGGRTFSYTDEVRSKIIYGHMFLINDKNKIAVINKKIKDVALAIMKHPQQFARAMFHFGKVFGIMRKAEAEAEAARPAILAAFESKWKQNVNVTNFKIFEPTLKPESKSTRMAFTDMNHPDRAIFFCLLQERMSDLFDFSTKIIKRN